MGQGDFRINFDSNVSDFAGNVKAQLGGIDSALAGLRANLQVHATEIETILNSIGGKRNSTVAARLNESLGLNKLGEVGDTIAAKLQNSIALALEQGIQRGLQKVRNIHIPITADLQTPGGGAVGQSNAVRFVPAAEPGQPGRGRPTTLTVPDEAINNLREARAAVVSFTQYVRKTRDAATEATGELQKLVAQLNEVKRVRPDIAPSHTFAAGAAGPVGAFDATQLVSALVASLGSGASLGAIQQSGAKLAQAQAEGLQKGIDDELRRQPIGRVNLDAFRSSVNLSDSSTEGFIANRTEALIAKKMDEKVAAVRATIEASLLRNINNPEGFFQKTGGIPLNKDRTPVDIGSLNPNELLHAMVSRLKTVTIGRLDKSDPDYDSNAQAAKAAFSKLPQPKDMYQILFNALKSQNLLSPEGPQSFRHTILVNEAAERAVQKSQAASASSVSSALSPEDAKILDAARAVATKLGIDPSTIDANASSILSNVRAQASGGVAPKGSNIGAAGDAEAGLRRNLFALQDQVRRNIIDLLPNRRGNEVDAERRRVAGTLSPDKLVAEVGKFLSGDDTPLGKSKIGKLKQQTDILQQTIESLERVPENAKKAESLQKTVEGIRKAEEALTGKDSGASAGELTGRAKKLQETYDLRQKDLEAVKTLSERGFQVSLPSLVERPLPGGKIFDGTIGGGRGGSTIDPLGLPDTVRAGAEPTAANLSNATAGQRYLTKEDLLGEISRLRSGGTGASPRSLVPYSQGQTIEDQIGLLEGAVREIERRERAHGLSKDIGKLVTEPGFRPELLSGLEYAPQLQRQFDAVLSEKLNIKGSQNQIFPEDLFGTAKVDAALQIQGRVATREQFKEQNLNRSALSGAFLELLNTPRFQVRKGGDFENRYLSNILLPNGLDKIPSVSAISNNIKQAGVDPIVHGTQLNEAIKGFQTAIKVASQNFGNVAKNVRDGKIDTDEAERIFDNSVGQVRAAIERIFGRQELPQTPGRIKAEQEAQKRKEALFDQESNNELQRNLAARRSYTASTLDLGDVLSIPGSRLLTAGAKQEDREHVAKAFGSDRYADLNNLQGLLRTHSGYFGENPLIASSKVGGGQLFELLEDLRQIGSGKAAQNLGDLPGGQKELLGLQKRLSGGDLDLAQQLTGKSVYERVVVTEQQANAERLKAYAKFNAEYRELKKEEAGIVRLHAEHMGRLLATGADPRGPEARELNKTLDLWSRDFAAREADIQRRSVAAGRNIVARDELVLADPSSTEAEAANRILADAQKRVGVALQNPLVRHGGSQEVAEQRITKAVDDVVRRLVARITDDNTVLADKNLGVKLQGYGESGAIFDTSSYTDVLRNYGSTFDNGLLSDRRNQFTEKEFRRYVANAGTRMDPEQIAARASSKPGGGRANVSDAVEGAAAAGAEVAASAAVDGAQAVANDVKKKTESVTKRQAQAAQALGSLNSTVLGIVRDGRVDRSRYFDAALELQHSDTSAGLPPRGLKKALRTVGDAAALLPADRAGLAAEADALGEQRLRQRYAERLVAGKGADAEIADLKSAFDAFGASAGQDVTVVEARLKELAAAARRAEAALEAAGLGAGKAFQAAAYSIGLTEQELSKKIAAGGGSRGGGGGRKPPVGTGGGPTDDGRDPDEEARILAKQIELEKAYARSRQDGMALQRLFDAQEAYHSAQFSDNARVRIRALGELQAAQIAYNEQESAGGYQRLTSQNQRTFAGRLLRGVGNAVNRYTGDLVVFAGAAKLQQVVQEAFQLQREFIRVDSGLQAVNESSVGLRGNLGGIASELGAPLAEVYQTASELVGVFQNVADLTFATHVVEQLKLISDGALSTTEAFRGFAAISAVYGEEGNQKEQIKQFADFTTQAQNLTGTNVADVVEGTARLAPEAQAFGINLPTLVAVVAEATKRSGQSGEATGEQLSRALSTFQSGKVQELLTRSDINVATEEDLQSGNFGKVLQNLLEAVASGRIGEEALGELRHAIGGGRQAAVTSALIGSPDAAKVALERIKGVTEDSSGKAQQRADRLIDTISAQIGRFGANISNLAQVIVNSGLLNLFALMLKTFNDLAGGVLQVATNVSDFIDQLGPLGDVFKTVGVGTVGLLAGLKIAQGFIESFQALQQTTGVTGALTRKASDFKDRIVGSVFGDDDEDGDGGGGPTFFGRLGQSRTGSRIAAYGRARAGDVRNVAAAAQLTGSAAMARNASQVAAGFSLLGGAIAPLLPLLGALAAALVAFIALRGILKAFEISRASDQGRKTLGTGTQAGDASGLRTEADKAQADADRIRKSSSGFFGRIGRFISPEDTEGQIKDLEAKSKQLKAEAAAIEASAARGGSAFGSAGAQSVDSLNTTLDRLAERGASASEIFAQLAKSLDLATGAAQTAALQNAPKGSVAVAGGSEAFADSIFLNDKKLGQLVGDKLSIPTMRYKIGPDGNFVRENLNGDVRDSDLLNVGETRTVRNTTAGSLGEGVTGTLGQDTDVTLSAEARKGLIESVKNIIEGKEFLTTDDQAAVADAVVQAWTAAGIADPEVLKKIRDQVLGNFKKRTISNIANVSDFGISAEEQTKLIETVSKAGSAQVSDAQARGASRGEVAGILQNQYTTLDKFGAHVASSGGDVTGQLNQAILAANNAVKVAFAEHISKLLEVESIGKSESEVKALTAQAKKILGLANNIDPSALPVAAQSLSSAETTVTNKLITQTSLTFTSITQAIQQSLANAKALLAAAALLEAKAAEAFARADLTGSGDYERVGIRLGSQAADRRREAGDEQKRADTLAGPKAGAKAGGSSDVQDTIDGLNSSLSSAAKDSAAAINAARAAANADPRDRVAQAAADILKAKADMADATKGTVAYYNALKALKEARIAHRLAQIELTNSALALNVLPGDSYGNAVLKLREDRNLLRGMLRGTTEYNKQLKQIAEDREALAQEISKAKSVSYSLTHDITNPLTDAANALREAKEKLKRDLASGKATQQQINEDKLAVKEAQANYENTQFNRNLNIASLNYKLGQSAATANAAGALSFRQYVAYLESEQARLLAIKKRTDQQQEQLGQVTDTLDALKSSLQGQFNIGDIKAPTPYEARRFIKQQVASATAAAQSVGGTYSTSSTTSTQSYQTVNISVNGADLVQVKALLTSMLGTKATQSYSTTTRKV